MLGAGFKPVGELHSHPFDSAFVANAVIIWGVRSDKFSFILELFSDGSFLALVIACDTAAHKIHLDFDMLVCVCLRAALPHHSTTLCLLPRFWTTQNWVQHVNGCGARSILRPAAVILRGVIKK